MPPNDPNHTNSSGGTIGNTQTNYNSGGGSGATTGARGATGPGGEKSVTGSSGSKVSGYGSNTTSKTPGSTAGAQKSSTGDRGPLGPGGEKSSTGSTAGGAGKSGFGSNTTSKTPGGAKSSTPNSSTGPRGPLGPGGEPKSPSQVGPSTGVKPTGPRGPLGPGGQASNPSQIKPPSQVAAPGKTNLGGGPTTTTIPAADPRRRQTAFANPTTPIQGNVLRQQVGTPTQQAMAEEARKRRNVGPDNTLGSIVAGDNYMRTPTGPTPTGQQVSDLTGIGAIDGVRPGFPSLQPSQPKIAGRVPTGPQIASYDPLTSVNAPGATVPSAPGAMASLPANPGRGITRPGAPPVSAPGKSDLGGAIAGPGPRGLPGARPGDLTAPAPTSTPGKSDLGGNPIATTVPTTDPRRNQQAFQNPTTPIQGRVLMQQVGTPAQQAIADAALARRASELGPAVADPRRGQATFANPTTPIQGNVQRQQVGTPTQQALANEALQRRQVATGPRGLPGAQPSDLKQNVSYPAYTPAERVTAIEPYQNDPLLQSMPPNPTGARGLPGLRPSDLAAAPTAIAETPDYEGAQPNPGNNVDRRMANYQTGRMPVDPADETGAADYIAPGPLDSDPDVMGAPDEGEFDTGAPDDGIGGFDTGNTFNANTPEQYGDTPGGEIGGGPTMGDGGDSPILYDPDGNPLPNQGGGGGGGGTPAPGEPGAEGPAPIPGVENLMPWDVSTYMQLRDIYAQSNIDYTPEQFMDEYYDTRALANPSVDLPDRPSPETSALAAQYAQTPTVGINPADELIAA